MSYKLQSIVIPKEYYTLKQAEDWIIKNNYKLVEKVDETPNEWRFRQLSPVYLKNIKMDNYRTKTLPNHIMLIIGYPNIKKGGELKDDEDIEDKWNELSLYSNPIQVFKNAKKYLGKDAKLGLSTRKDKKYMIEKPDGRWVHFGQMGYEDFTKHKDIKRRKKYLQRATNIKGDWNDLYSPNNLSINILW